MTMVNVAKYIRTIAKQTAAASVAWKVNRPLEQIVCKQEAIHSRQTSHNWYHDYAVWVLYENSTVCRGICWVRVCVQLWWTLNKLKSAHYWRARGFQVSEICNDSFCISFLCNETQHNNWICPIIYTKVFYYFHFRWTLSLYSCSAMFSSWNCKLLRRLEYYQLAFTFVVTNFETIDASIAFSIALDVRLILGQIIGQITK